jgi:hypothetical protein
MPYLNDRVFDLGLNVLDTEANRLDICTTEPATYVQAITTYTCGNKTSLSIGAPAAGAISGRKVTVAAINDGTVTTTASAAFWGVTDTVNSRLLAAGALATAQTVTGGNTFTLGTIDITLRGLT